SRDIIIASIADPGGRSRAAYPAGGPRESAIHRRSVPTRSPRPSSVDLVTPPRGGPKILAGSYAWLQANALVRDLPAIPDKPGERSGTDSDISPRGGRWVYSRPGLARSCSNRGTLPG